jgi:hypothetical protein
MSSVSTERLISGAFTRMGEAELVSSPIVSSFQVLSLGFIWSSLRVCSEKQLERGAPL